jgi:hypothetical protein
MGKMLVRVSETYLSVTIGDFTFYLSHRVLSCHTTTISTLIQSNHSFLSDKSIPPYITHSPILPSTSRITKNRIRLSGFFFFFWVFLESTKPPNDSFGIPIPGSHHQPCQIVSQRSQISGTSLHDSPAVRAVHCFFVANVAGRGPEVLYLFPELGDGRPPPIGLEPSERLGGVKKERKVMVEGWWVV